MLFKCLCHNQPTLVRSQLPVVAGGANIPALNDLLVPYGVAFGRGVLEGSVQVGIPVFSSLHVGVSSMAAGYRLHC